MLHFRRIAIVGLLATMCCWSANESTMAAKKKNVIRRLSFNKSARSVELFDGIKAGELTTRVAVKDEKSATVYISNETDQPLTVELPNAVAGVHVLTQFQPLGAIGQTTDGANGGLNGGNGNGQTTGGQLNPIGGNNQPGLNGPGNNNGFGNIGPGNGFFSIPPEATVALQLDSVCLQHGKKNPTAAMKYALRPIESVIKDNTGLINMLATFDPDQSKRNAVQAAAWHLANDMTWDQLNSKPRKRLGRPTTKWFTNNELKTAQRIVKTAKDSKKETKQPKTNPSRTVARR